MQTVCVAYAHTFLCCTREVQKIGDACRQANSGDRICAMVATRMDTFQYQVANFTKKCVKTVVTWSID